MYITVRLVIDLYVQIYIIFENKFGRKIDTHILLSYFLAFQPNMSHSFMLVDVHDPHDWIHIYERGRKIVTQIISMRTDAPTYRSCYRDMQRPKLSRVFVD